MAEEKDELTQSSSQDASCEYNNRYQTSKSVHKGLSTSFLKKIFFISIGSSIEWFEFTLFTYTLVYISISFLPNVDFKENLVFLFFLFGVAFLARPFGGAIWGHVGDKYGRIKALSSSSLLIAFSMFLMACIPSYNSIGVWAIVLLIIIRILQGVAIAGEYAGACTTLFEYGCEIKRAGLMTAISVAISNSGFFISLALITFSEWFFTSQQMNAYGWRLLYVFGGFLGLTFFFIRRNIPEPTAYVGREKINESPLRCLLSKYKKEIVLTVFLVTIFYSLYWIFIIWMPDILNTILIQNSTSYKLNNTYLSIAMGILVISNIISGYFADYFGFRKFMVIASIVSSCVVIPTVILLVITHDFRYFFLVYPFLALIGPTITTLCTASVPSGVRYSLLGFAYNLAMPSALLPILMSYIYNYTNSFYFVIYFVVVFYIVLIFSSCFMFIKRNSINYSATSVKNVLIYVEH